MNTKLRFPTPLFAAVILAATSMCSVRSVSAYLADEAAAINIITPGFQITEIIEDFPDVPPASPDSDPEFIKTVTIQNPSFTSEGNVACYIRARILFSNDEIGNALIITGMDMERWKKDSDGYYYYTEIVSPGEQTTPLMQSIEINSSLLPDKARYAEDFHLWIYEESIQAWGADNYIDAWKSDSSEREEGGS